MLTLNERIEAILKAYLLDAGYADYRYQIANQDRAVEAIQALIDEAIVAELRKIMDRHLEIEENGGTSLPLLLVANRLVELTTPKEEQN